MNFNNSVNLRSPVEFFPPDFGYIAPFASGFYTEANFRNFDLL